MTTTEIKKEIKANCRRKMRLAIQELRKIKSQGIGKFGLGFSLTYSLDLNLESIVKAETKYLLYRRLVWALEGKDLAAILIENSNYAFGLVKEGGYLRSTSPGSRAIAEYKGEAALQVYEQIQNYAEWI